MRITNTDFIDQVRHVIRITKESKTNTEDNILKKININTGVPKCDLKVLFDKYSGKYWTVKQSDKGRLMVNESKWQMLALYLHEDDDFGGK